jgi:hypothetical protein
VQCNVRATKQQIEQSAKLLEEAMAGGPQGAAAAAGAEAAAGAPAQPIPAAIPRPPMPVPPPRPVAQQVPQSAPQPAQQPMPQPAPQPVPQSAPPVPQPAAAQPAPQNAPLPAPPAEVPEKYAGMVRRSFKLLSQLPPGDANGQRLSRAYVAFIKALEISDPDIEDCFEDLSDLYFRCK